MDDSANVARILQKARSLVIEDRIAANMVPARGFASYNVMLPIVWAVRVDVGREASGAISGAMNTAGQIGGVIMSIGYGALVDSYGWNLPLGLIACSCFVSMLFWLKIDPSKPLVRARD